jgi:Tfp pilus assembly protein PilX
MTTTRPPRDRQRGNSLVLALVVLSALATLGSLTVISVQSSLKTSTNDRSQAIAMYAAESGAAVAMDFLRTNYATDWSTYVTPGNAPPLMMLPFPSNNAQPDAPNNLFSSTPPPGYNAWYSVEVLNNRNDPGFLPASNSDTDKQIIIRSTGHGPQGSVSILEWEVQAKDGASPMILLGWHVVL